MPTQLNNTSNIDFRNLTAAQKSQYAVVFGCLCLSDAGLEINEESLNKLISKSGNEIESYWPGLFINALDGRDINSFVEEINFAPANNTRLPETLKYEEKDEDSESEEEANVSMAGFFSDSD